MNSTSKQPDDGAKGTIEQLEKQRGWIVRQMLEIRSMAKGKIVKQYLEATRKGEAEPTHFGPYYSIVFWNADTGKTQSKRLKTREEIERAQKDIENYQRFESLCKDYVETTQQLSDVEGSTEAATHKKKPKSCSRRTRR